MARYQVTVPYITVTTAGPFGPRMTGYYKDAVLPEDVPQAQLDAHEAGGLIVKLEEPSAPVEAEVEDVSEPLVFEAEKPSRDQPKSSWVAYAVARTAGTPGELSTEDADKLSKAELVERYGKAE